MQQLCHCPPRPLTIKQAAEHLQVSPKTLRRWIDTGNLIAHRLGRQWRISETDLQSFIRMRRQG
ncbi:MAG TPA: DNA-binding protein [Rhodospirillales bacterium]|nr:DNA-binding protein [Rhodospirillales bacterium]